MVISKSADPSIVPLIDIINQDDPFQNFDGETIEDEIRKDLNLKQGDSCDYYTEPNHNFYLIIKIYNPTEYDLLSCVVNGRVINPINFLILPITTILFLFLIPELILEKMN